MRQIVTDTHAKVQAGDGAGAMSMAMLKSPLVAK